MWTLLDLCSYLMVIVQRADATWAVMLKAIAWESTKCAGHQHHHTRAAALWLISPMVHVAIDSVVLVFRDDPFYDFLGLPCKNGI